ncbi:hypothetical protein JCM1393_25280 [Clostridium carnis]
MSKRKTFKKTIEIFLVLIIFTFNKTCLAATVVRSSPARVATRSSTSSFKSGSFKSSSKSSSSTSKTNKVKNNSSNKETSKNNKANTKTESKNKTTVIKKTYINNNNTTYINDRGESYRTSFWDNYWLYRMATSHNTAVITTNGTTETINYGFSGIWKDILTGVIIISTIAGVVFLIKRKKY